MRAREFVQAARFIVVAIGLALATTDVIAEPSPAAAPPAGTQDELRREVGQKPVRLRVRQATYEFERVRLDTAGVWFRPGEQLPVARWSGGEKERPEPLAAPVSWGEIQNMHARHSGVGRGALIGAVVLPIVILAWPHPNYSDDWTAAYAMAGIPLGALAGGVVGTLVPQWKQVWPRPHP